MLVASYMSASSSSLLMHLGRQLKMAQVRGSLPSMWETKMEVQAAVLIHAHPQLLVEWKTSGSQGASYSGHPLLLSRGIC